MPTKPKIVCLCGSTKFKDAYTAENKIQTLMGNIVLTVGWLTHKGSNRVTPTVKKELDELHLRKIDLCDFVFVLNVDGYIGESTKNEIAYATKIGKPIEYLEEDEDPFEADNDVAFFKFNHVPKEHQKALEELGHANEFKIDDFLLHIDMLHDMFEFFEIAGTFSTYPEAFTALTNKLNEGRKDK